MKVLFLGVTQFKEEHASFVDTFELYKPIPNYLKGLRIVWFNMNLPFKFLWLNNLIRSELNNYNVIILSSTIFNNKVINEIESRCAEKCKLILWFWNPINKVGYPKISSRWKKVSFDLVDAENYKIRFNNTYYFKDFVKLSNLTNRLSSVSRTVFFLGQDKGRLTELLAVQQLLKDNGLNLVLHVVKDGTSKKVDYSYKPKLAYDAVIKEFLKYDILLDYNQEGQSGLTLRIMEGLFFEKKVITNNKFVKLYDFYNPANIFILNEDSIDKLGEFANNNYEHIPEEIKIKYDFPQWLNRLVNE